MVIEVAAWRRRKRAKFLCSSLSAVQASQRAATTVRHGAKLAIHLLQRCCHFLPLPGSQSVHCCRHEGSLDDLRQGSLRGHHYVQKR